MMKPRTISQFVAALLLFLAIPAFFFSNFSQNQDGFQVSRRVLYQAKTARISLSSNEVGQYVFVLGLEGTGHHMMQSLWERCDGCVPVGGEFNRLYYWHSAKGKKEFTGGIFGGIDPKENQKDYHMLVKEMRELSQRLRGKLLVLNTWANTGSAGELSYPNFKGPHRFTMHPHALQLAGAARAAGTKVRFIVLVRSAREMIISTTVKRSFDTPSHQIKTLEDMCHELKYTLLALDPQNFGCVDYNGLESRMLERAGEAAGFQGPTFRTTLHSIFQLGGHSSSKKKKATKPTPSLGGNALQALEGCVSQIRLLCAKAG